MNSDNNVERLPSILRRRDDVVEQLKEAFSTGNLLLDEFESRVSKAEKAYEVTELDNLVIDLPKVGISTEVTEVETVNCNMATKKLVGSILQTKKLNIEASMSTITINYIEEQPIRGVQEINVQMNMANLILYLPDDVVVENKLSEEMTTFKEYRNRYYNPKNARTLIKITGTTKMTTIKIKRKRYWFFFRKK